MSILELLAATFGLAAVGLTILRSVWCWPTGLVQVLLYTKVFYDAKLYSQTWLQVVFALLQVHGWWRWKSSLHQAGEQTSDLKQVRVERLRGSAIWLALAAASTIALTVGYAMQRLTDAAWPWADATIAGLSLVAQVLLIGRFLENWYLWIVVNLLTMAVCSQQQLWPTVALYMAFFIMAISGLRAWQQQWELQTSVVVRAHGLDQPQAESER